MRSEYKSGGRSLKIHTPTHEIFHHVPDYLTNHITNPHHVHYRGPHGVTYHDPTTGVKNNHGFFVMCRGWTCT
ncbi:unnamed protein product [Caenorhabditis bovis]|uniref:Uncharacterized protein n=1 Tax=Caenorhabditis bovis TaxID=2654633 RepID=A0A8S1F7K2_9PELO|nr:unnamed protein product [Caenorhabditis bovis]